MHKLLWTTIVHGLNASGRSIRTEMSLKEEDVLIETADTPPHQNTRIYIASCRRIRTEMSLEEEDALIDTTDKPSDHSTTVETHVEPRRYHNPLRRFDVAMSILAIIVAVTMLACLPLLGYYMYLVSS